MGPTLDATGHPENLRKLAIEIRMAGGESFHHSFSFAEEVGPPVARRTARRLLGMVRVAVNGAAIAAKLPILELKEARTLRDLLGARLHHEMNVHLLWTAIQEALHGVRVGLGRSAASKVVESEFQPDAECDGRLAEAFHKDAMWEFDHAVVELLRIQDLAARLVFESLVPGFLPVKRSSAHWERTITARRVIRAIRQRSRSSERLLTLSDEDRSNVSCLFDAHEADPMRLLSQPENAPHRADRWPPSDGAAESGSFRARDFVCDRHCA